MNGLWTLEKREIVRVRWKLNRGTVKVRWKEKKRTAVVQIQILERPVTAKECNHNGALATRTVRDGGAQGRLRAPSFVLHPRAQDPFSSTCSHSGPGARQEELLRLMTE